jgi:dTMP kinase
MRGRLISFEGVDGCGKSTQAAMLAAHLEGRGEQVVLTREPGGTPAGERIREALLATESLTPLAEAHLFAAARAELVATVIAPALAAGRWVVCDRFIDSSLAYQGVARGLGLDAIWELNRAAVGDCLPDRTILLTLPVADAAARRAAVDDDRIEREGDGLQRAVAEGYERLATRYPGRIVRVDAEGTQQEVHERVVAAVP